MHFPGPFEKYAPKYPWENIETLTFEYIMGL